MNIAFKVSTLRKFTEANPESETLQEWERAHRWRSPNDRVDIEIDCLSDAELEQLESFVKSSSTTADRTALMQIQNIRVLQSEYSSDRVTRLEQVVSAFKHFFEDAPNKWVFMTDPHDARLLPMYVSSINYYPDEWEIKGKRRKLISQAYVAMYCKCICRGQQISRRFYWDRSSINGQSGTLLTELLRVHSLTKENKRAVAHYAVENDRYKDVATKTGTQFLASGFSRITKGNSYRSDVHMDSMVIDGRMSKVVMDDDSEEGSAKRISDDIPKSVVSSDEAAFWKSGLTSVYDATTVEELDEAYQSDDDDDADEIPVTIPVWPFVKVFNLAKHAFCEMHVSDLHDYPWDKSAFDKLILPQSDKDLLEILVNGTQDLMEDIIAGKTGGIIVVATGATGTGKTLTAEVYSEFIEKPVYSIQCAQLGMNVESIENNLKTVLRRAQRWNALLLLDEADVYVRMRGDDILQNAIVGVFLRVLEYYQGVLFMTSNRDTIIDEAILSRATAHIRYKNPDEKMRFDLWRVLGKQYNVEFTDEELKRLAAAFVVAGRDIKSMLKLATLILKRAGGKVDFALLEKTYQFQDTVETLGKKSN